MTMVCSDGREVDLTNQAECGVLKLPTPPYLETSFKATMRRLLSFTEMFEIARRELMVRGKVRHQGRINRKGRNAVKMLMGRMMAAKWAWVKPNGVVDPVMEGETR